MRKEDLISLRVSYITPDSPNYFSSEEIFVHVKYKDLLKLSSTLDVR